MRVSINWFNYLIEEKSLYFIRLINYQTLSAFASAPCTTGPVCDDVCSLKIRESHIIIRDKWRSCEKRERERISEREVGSLAFRILWGGDLPLSYSRYTHAQWTSLIGTRSPWLESRRLRLCGRHRWLLQMDGYVPPNVEFECLLCFIAKNGFCEWLNRTRAAQKSRNVAVSIVRIKIVLIYVDLDGYEKRYI